MREFRGTGNGFKIITIYLTAEVGSYIAFDRLLIGILDQEQFLMLGPGAKWSRTVLGFVDYDKQ